MRRDQITYGSTTEGKEFKNTGFKRCEKPLKAFKLMGGTQ
jgi:hypothetical protein